MPKWTGFRWPPKEWWFGFPDGTIWTNHPISHFLPGMLIQPIIMVLFPGMAIWQRLLLLGLFAGHREELQIEFTKGYPVYSAIGDTLFVVLGAALVEGVLSWVF